MPPEETFTGIGRYRGKIYITLLLALQFATLIVNVLFFHVFFSILVSVQPKSAELTALFFCQALVLVPHLGNYLPDTKQFINAT